MKLNTLLVVSAVVSLIFGVVFVVASGLVLLPVGGMPMEQLTEQALGAAFIGFAVLNWLARNVTDAEALRAIVLANLVTNTIVFVVSLIAEIGGVMNAVGWVLVVIPLLFALGFAYSLFMRPSVAPNVSG